MRKSSMYILSFSDGTVKVGRADDVIKRIDEHKVQARQFGVSIVYSWASAVVDNPAEVGRVLIGAANLLGEPTSGREWFKDIDAERLTVFAEEALGLVRIEEDQRKRSRGSMEALKDAVLRFVSSNPGAKVTTIRREVRGKAERIHRALSSLVEDGRLKVVELGGTGSAKGYFATGEVEQ